MPKIYVEAWSPDFGAPLDLVDGLDAGKVDETVEVDGEWGPRAGADDGVERVAFVDGTLRIDARVLLEGADGPVSGVCASYAVGAVCWDRRGRRCELQDLEVRRVSIFTSGEAQEVDAGAGLRYLPESVADDDPASLTRRLHGLMRSAESALASRLAGSGWFVVSDGPLNELASVDTVGYIKSHRVMYLGRERNGLVGRLGPGERTPLFAIGEFRRYSWYAGLAPGQAGTHPWSKVARCEVAAAVGLERAVGLADRTTALLPQVASPPFRDPRAPQNLVPISGLEVMLRHRMGDRRMVFRAIRAAATGEAA